MSEQLIQAKMLVAGAWEGGHDQTEIRNPALPDEVVGTRCAARQQTRSARFAHLRPRNRHGRGSALQSVPNLK